MSVLATQLESKLLPGMFCPPEFSALFDLIEKNGLYGDSYDERIGFLFPEDELKAGWTDTD